MVAGVPCGICTPAATFTALETDARYCFPAGSVWESAASIIFTEIETPAAGAFCGCAFRARSDGEKVVAVEIKMQRKTK
jgi:hypothetical protein